MGKADNATDSIFKAVFEIYTFWGKRICLFDDNKRFVLEMKMFDGTCFFVHFCGE